MLIAWPSLEANAQIQGTRHDLSPTGGGMWGAADEDEICVYCHTPHGSNPIAPLWNKAVRAATYTLYNSDTLDALPNQPQGYSLACLTCHDGVTALNALVNPSQNVPTMPAIGDQLGDVYYPGGATAYQAVNIGGSYPANPNVDDLADDHPISFTFDAALTGVDNGLQLPPPGDPVMLLGPSADQLECPTCHDAHDSTFPPFLVKSAANSQLCRTCHLK